MPRTWALQLLTVAGGVYSQSLCDAIAASNMLVVCAAGNTGQDNDINQQYPSNYELENIIAVAASMQSDEPCMYPGVEFYMEQLQDLFAPVGHILSTIPPDPPSETPTEDYGFLWFFNGYTHVTGVAALSWYPGHAAHFDGPGWSRKLHCERYHNGALQT